MAKELKDLTREDYEAYEETRMEGLTNMFDVERGCALSGLDRKTYIGVMNHYGEPRDAFEEGQE